MAHPVFTFPGGTPQIDLSRSPKEEEKSLWLLNGALSSIARFSSNFAACVHLFDYCALQNSVLPDPRSEAFSTWQFVAARDAVMSIWHFRQEMHAAHDLANQSPYLIPSLNRASLGTSHSRFDKYFPDFAGIRHAVAHAGEMSKTEAKFDENAFTGSYEGHGIKIADSKGTMIQDCFSGRTYICTHEGKIVHCDISSATVSRLNEVKGLFYQGFSGDSQALPPVASED